VGETIDKMAINYNAGTNTITVLGYTSAIPCTFHDIALADTAGGWGVVSEAHGSQFYLTCHLRIGDGNTYAYIRTLAECILWGTSNYQLLIEQYGYFQAGRLLNNRPVEGSMIRNEWPAYASPWFGFRAYTGSSVRLYSTLYFGNNTAIHLEGDFRGDNAHFLRAHHSGMTSTGSFNVVRFENIDQAALAYIGTQSFDRIEIYNTQDGVSAHGGENVLLSNSKIYANRYSLWVRNSSVITVRNSEFDAAKIYGEIGGGTVAEEYSFDLRVLQEKSSSPPIPGASVKIWDKLNTLVTNTTTDGNGDIITQYLVANKWIGTGLPPPKTEYTPHTIEITKEGYKSYKIKFSIGGKTGWEIGLLDVQAVQFMDNDLILQLAPESIEDDRNIFIKV
jgi:hypothetical protein